MLKYHVFSCYKSRSILLVCTTGNIVYKRYLYIRSKVWHDEHGKVSERAQNAFIASFTGKSRHELERNWNSSKGGGGGAKSAGIFIY